jgi:DNA-binding transcriptional MocR family regulator
VKDIDELERSIQWLHSIGGKRYGRHWRRVVIFVDRMRILQIQYSTILLNCTGTLGTTVIPAAAGEATRVEQVMALVRERIQQRVLSPGARLSSVRAMAEATGFSKSTVVEAYARLVAERVIRSRAGSGFYIAAPLAPLSLAQVGPRLDREIDPLWMLRQSLTAGTTSLKPGCGWLPDEWMPEELLAKGMRSMARVRRPSVTGYAPPLGSEPLRRLLARRLADQGIHASPDQVLLTDSGTHAIDLVCRFLIEPGDVVLVDDPSYFNFHALLRAHRARVVGVPFTPAGPNVDEFAQALVDHRPRFYLMNSALHNPTGATLSAATTHRIMKLAEAHDLVVVEDDIFADFETEPAPRLAALDGFNRVIRVGSFSKSVSTSIRCGHIVAKPEWTAALSDLRIATGMSGSPLAASLQHYVLADAGFRRHMDHVRARLQEKQTHTIKRLKVIGVTPWIEPSGGLFLWCKLPDALDAADVARRALADEVLFAPGNVFSVSQSAGSFMRFNVAMMEDPKILRVLESAMTESARDSGSSGSST